MLFLIHIILIGAETCSEEFAFVQKIEKRRPVENIDKALNYL